MHKECNVAKMEADGVKLVRRVSGGGAAHHDTGNVNFSFIAAEAVLITGGSWIWSCRP